MNRKCFMFIIAVIFLGVGCSSSKGVSVKRLYGPYPYGVSEDENEKKEALAYLKEYIQVLESSPMKTVVGTPEDEQRSEDARTKLPNSLKYFAVILDEISDTAYLKEIRGKYSPAPQNAVTHDLHLIDTETASRLVGLMDKSKEDFTLLYKNEIPLRFDKTIDFISSCAGKNIGTYYVESYFHYMTKDGKEKRIIKPGLCKDGLDIRLRGNLQADNKSVAISYTISSSLPRKGYSVHIQGSEGVAALRENAFLKFSCADKIDIPLNGTVVMECRPFGSDLTEAEKCKRLLVFITCKTGDNPDTSQQSLSKQ